MKSYDILKSSDLNNLHTFDGTGLQTYNNEFSVFLEAIHIDGSLEERDVQNITATSEAGQVWLIKQDDTYRVTSALRDRLTSLLAIEGVNLVQLKLTPYTKPSVGSTEFPNEAATANQLEEEFRKRDLQDEFILEETLSKTNEVTDDHSGQLDDLRNELAELRAKGAIVGRQVHLDIDENITRLAANPWTRLGSGIKLRPEADDIEIDLTHNDEIFTQRYRIGSIPIVDPKSSPRTGLKEAFEFQASNELYCAKDAEGFLYVAAKTAVDNVRIQLYEIVYGDNEGVANLVAGFDKRLTEVEKQIAQLETADHRDLFERAEKSNEVLPSDEIIFNQSKDSRKVITDENDITGQAGVIGDRLGSLAVAAIDVGSVKETLYYAATTDVDAFSLDNNADDELSNVEKNRVLELTDHLGRTIEGVLVIRRRTATAPGYITLISERDSLPLTLLVANNDGTVLQRLTENYTENLGSINGNDVGGYSWDSYEVNVDYDFQETVFGPADSPKEVADIILRIQPLSSAIGGRNINHLNIRLGSVSGEAPGIKKAPATALLKAVRDAESAALAPRFADIDKRIEEASQTGGGVSADVLSVNGHPLLADSVLDLFGTNTADFNAAPANTTYDLVFNTFISPDFATSINNELTRESASITVGIGLGRYTITPANARLKAGHQNLIFKIPKSEVSNLRDNTAQGEAVRSIIRAGTVGTIIAQVTTTIDSNFQVPNLPETWAERGNKDPIPANGNKFDEIKNKVVIKRWAAGRAPQDYNNWHTASELTISGVVLDKKYKINATVELDTSLNSNAASRIDLEIGYWKASGGGFTKLADASVEYTSNSASGRINEITLNDIEYVEVKSTDNPEINAARPGTTYFGARLQTQNFGSGIVKLIARETNNEEFVNNF